MGEDFVLQEFSSQQKKEFRLKVMEETEILAQWIEQERFEKDSSCFGYESEGWLIDQDGLPAPENQKFLENLGDPSVVTELAKFNFELNGSIFKLDPELFNNINEEMTLKETRIRSCAESMGLRPAWIGILPTVRDDMLGMDNMSEKNRYFELSRETLKLRKNLPIPIKIDRYDSIDLERTDIMSESVATSLQIHVQVHQENSVRMFNSSQLISAPLLAISANSPFLFGKKLWDETRIPIFEQTLSFKDANSEVTENPVSFGFTYLENSFLELFQENIKNYPIILPILFSDKSENLRHLKFLNGQIWRWNRPIIGTGSTPHLRIEQRAIPSGPSAVDSVANMAFYIGLLFYYARPEANWETQIDFEKIKSNFYGCAKLGLKSEVDWPGESRPINVQTLLYEKLLPQSISGLKQLGISEDSISFFLNDILKNRIKTGWTGAAWQKSYIDTHGFDFQTMVNAYVENQSSMQPVYKWKI